MLHLATVVVVASSLAQASPVIHERALRMLNDWIVAVDQHRAGERDEALQTIGKWSYSELEVMRGYVDAIAEVPVNTKSRAAFRAQIKRTDLHAIEERTKDLRRRGDFDEFRRRAVILHTDVALLWYLPAEVDPPQARERQPWHRRDQAAPAVDVKSADGQIERFEPANPHWDYARDLLEALPAKPRRDPIVAQWYRTLGAYFANQDDLAHALRHFDNARRIVPDDPGVLFGDACLQETFGSPKVQDFVRVTTLPNGLRIIGVHAADTHFRRAESLLRRALAAQPDFLEARLRLGRVLAERRQYEGALMELEPVMASKDRALAYYAHLFSGDAALAIGRGPESRAAYENAIRIYPESQAGRIGLAAAYRMSGDRQDALDALGGTLSWPLGERDSADEPWWDYYAGDGANVERLLAELRAPYRSSRR
ncbi:MAG TPA: tetratricopeptide repeat protein [Vicinamibacterales bacterium]|nr:tetratricopeptide repeat protein [Vicinamibacterales bacterium]